MRTFVAVDISQAGREAVGRLISELRPKADGLRWVRPESLHLTLKFLGEVSEEKLPELAEALRQSAEGIPPFDYTLVGKGCFPNCRRPRVLWIGVENPGREIFHLQRQVEDAFEAIGFQRENRKFTAHLTVARVKRPFGIEDAVHAFREFPLEPETVHVTEIRLMRSVLKPGGAEYSVLHAVPLAP
ncbi:MAG TPA: RNA 2',3'-cyclic phosphodiesterase [Bacteroidetes bacterium]|nr:RNA 2',3'-cyclic phosphodiesterase [Bacteroidota bacterium]